MQTASSSSLPPSKPRNAAGPPHPLPPSIKHPQTPPKRVQPPPKEIERIDDPKKCSTAFSKRHRTVVRKVNELYQLTGAHVAVIMFSPTGNLRCFGKPSVEEVFSEYLGHNGCVKHLQTPPKCVQPPLKEIKRIDDPKKCSTAFSKRHQCIINKASKLFQLTGAHVAVIMFSPSGNRRYFGKPSVEEVFSEYLSHNGCVMLPMSQSEWMEECDSFATKEDCPLLKKLKDFENNSSVNPDAGYDSGVGVDRSSKVSNDDKSVDCDSFSTLLVDSAAGVGSSGVGLADLEGVEIYGDLEDFIGLDDLEIS